MNKMVKNFLKLANNQVQIGLDIGGTLTKMSICLSKSNLEKNEFLEFDSLERIELEDNILFIKLFPTNKFDPDAIDFLKSKNILTIYSLFKRSRIISN